MDSDRDSSTEISSSGGESKGGRNRLRILGGRLTACASDECRVVDTTVTPHCPEDTGETAGKRDHRDPAASPLADLLGPRLQWVVRFELEDAPGRLRVFDF
jgi:hypothetical protein